MTNRQDRRGRRARPLKPTSEGRPRTAGRRLLVLVAVAALIVLSVASFQFAGGGASVTPSPSEVPSTAPALVSPASS